MKKKIILVILLFNFINLSINGYAVPPTYTIYDEKNDMKVFDYEFFEDLDLDYTDLEDCLNEIYESIENNWYNSKVCSSLTGNQIEDFGYADFVKFTIDDLDIDTAQIELEINGKFNEAFDLAIIIWNTPEDDNEQMIVSIMYSEELEDYYLIDYINEETIECEFEKETTDTGEGRQYKIKCEFNSNYWFYQEELYVLSITNFEDKNKSNVVIDIVPQPINEQRNYFYSIIIIILIVLIAALIILFKRYQNR